MNKLSPKKFFIFMSVFLLATIFFGNSTKIIDWWNYSSQVRNFEKISSISEINSKKENLIVYVGRETCPNCREFLPNLKEVLENKHKKIFYLDTDHLKERNLELNKLSKLGITSVPTIIIYKNGKFDRSINYPSNSELKKIFY